MLLHEPLGYENLDAGRGRRKTRRPSAGEVELDQPASQTRPDDVAADGATQHALELDQQRLGLYAGRPPGARIFGQRELDIGRAAVDRQQHPCQRCIGVDRRLRDWAEASGERASRWWLLRAAKCQVAIQPNWIERAHRTSGAGGAAEICLHFAEPPPTPRGHRFVYSRARVALAADLVRPLPTPGLGFDGKTSFLPCGPPADERARSRPTCTS